MFIYAFVALAWKSEPENNIANIYVKVQTAYVYNLEILGFRF